MGSFKHSFAHSGVILGVSAQDVRYNFASDVTSHYWTLSGSRSREPISSTRSPMRS